MALNRDAPPFDELERLAADASVKRYGRVDTLAEVEGLPIRVFRLGTTARDAPVFLVTGGVHGIERIGAEVAIAYLRTLAARLEWDELLHAALERCRIDVIPVVNPVGVALGTRANGRGVDLMRNAPTDDLGGTPLVGGQRISPRLPWYMGRADLPMEVEAATLVGFVERELSSAPLTIGVDVHSGFGFVDRLWYPYARTRAPSPEQPIIDALVRVIDGALPNHVYTIEQTARVYTIRGDLWDHMLDRRREADHGHLIPLTLEMGSWSWVRKNPLQGLTAAGRFNPVKPHRVRRTLRRHLALFDCLFHAAASRRWISLG